MSFPLYTAATTDDAAADSLDFGLCGPLLCSAGSFSVLNRPGHGVILQPRGGLVRVSSPPPLVPPVLSEQSDDADGHLLTRFLKDGVGGCAQVAEDAPWEVIPERLWESGRGNALCSMAFPRDDSHAGPSLLLAHPDGALLDRIAVSELRMRSLGAADWGLASLAASPVPHSFAPGRAPGPCSTIVQLDMIAHAPPFDGGLAGVASVAARSPRSVDVFSLQRGAGDGASSTDDSWSIKHAQSIHVGACDGGSGGACGTASCALNHFLPGEGALLDTRGALHVWDAGRGAASRHAGPGRCPHRRGPRAWLGAHSVATSETPAVPRDRSHMRHELKHPCWMWNTS
jgi:hypothetical protein